MHGKHGGALGAVDVHLDVAVMQRVGAVAALQGRECHAFAVGGAVAQGGELQGARLHAGGKVGGAHRFVHQAPFHGLLAAHAFHAGAKQVGQVVAHFALVGHAGQAAGAGQHAQQRHFRQAHRAGTVVDQNDFVTGQGQLVAATGAGAVHGSQKFQAAVGGRVFQAVAGFIRELAKVHLPGVAADAQHKDVGARAKHFVFGAGHDHGAHFGVFKADALDGVVELNVHAEVVAVELELVAGAQTGVFIKVGFEGGHCAVKAEFPVLVLRGLGFVTDTVEFGHGRCS